MKQDDIQDYIIGDVVEYYDKIMAIRELESILEDEKKGGEG